MFYEKLKLKQDKNLYDINVVIGTDTIFLFRTSLPSEIIPNIGDTIISDFENTQYTITKVIPLLIPNNELSNYALEIELLK